MIIKKGAYDFSGCRNEQAFKKSFINRCMNTKKLYAFCIETSETEAGFPDVMYLNKEDKTANFHEFKYTHADGKIKFEPTQPSFYRRHPDMPIDIIAYDSINNAVHLFSTTELFKEGSDYHINEKAEVNISKVFK